ncbi:type II toxin-antitoxin system VapB family antitoxin [Neisseria sp. CCUG17229]|uniref:type II toxin-antitoxin system VapB family antitoxin n=1 Tax=Neisseria sp. CCUG17229 TaxID=3392036 RepID=UPI003A1018DB
MQASIFKSNQSQAVRLPKRVAFPETVKRVEVIVQGESRLLVPAEQVWDSWFDNVSMPDDFMTERDQPAMQERESL